MTSMISDKHRTISRTAIGVAFSLCMVVMVSGCIRVGSEAPGGGQVRQESSSHEASTNRSEATKDDQACLTDGQKHAKLKELNEKESWLSGFAEHTVVRGGGNLVGRVLGLGPAGEYVELANDAKKMTVKGNVARDSIDTIVAKDYAPEAPTPVAPSSSADGASVVR